jgi:3D (Asp-Asp-Asp) domain-containing protein
VSTVFAGFSSRDNQAVLGSDTNLVVCGSKHVAGGPKVFPIGSRVLLASVGDYTVLLGLGRFSYAQMIAGDSR